jgi:hypothetical protein
LPSISIGEDADGYVGLCPMCSEQVADNRPATEPALQPAAVESNGESTTEVAGSPDKRHDKPATSQTQPSEKREKRRTKQPPLYMRMFTDRQMTALVRAVGHAGFPASEGPDRMRPLIEEFGEALMRAAADEVLEIDHTHEPPMARLTAEARKIAVGLLGRPPADA